MQDRYAGDVGDFMKLGLLRALSAEPDPLWLGVNWYLTADECHNADGKHTGYLDPASRHHRSLKNCDPELLCRLSEVVSGHRSVAAIEAARVLPAGSRTFPELLGVAMGDTLRRQWHGRALTRLARADLVFVDPDNGMRARRGPSRTSSPSPTSSPTTRPEARAWSSTTMRTEPRWGLGPSPPPTRGASGGHTDGAPGRGDCPTGELSVLLHRPRRAPPRPVGRRSRRLRRALASACRRDLIRSLTLRPVTAL